MPTWWEKAKSVYGERGYLVIARRSPFRIGAIVLTVTLPEGVDVRLPQPFRVVQETDLADYGHQHEMAGEMLGKDLDIFHFYRIVTE